MKYTKEQAEMLALLVLMGCAVVVLTFLYLVKPNFAAMATSKAELKKTEAKIAELGKASVALAKANKEKEEVTATIESGEKAILSGFAIGSPLYQVCVQAANKLKLELAFGVQRPGQLLEFKERTADGTQITRHYDEVSRTLDIHSGDFLTLCRFLSAVENANAGMRVTHLEIGNKSLEATEQNAGKVTAKVELSMLGMREGERPPPPVVGEIEDFNVHNPFGPEGGTTGDVEKAKIMDVLKGIKITGIWPEKLMMEVPLSGTTTKSPTTTAKKGGTFVAQGWKIKYVSRAAGSLVFEAVDDGKRYRAFTNYKGHVIKVIEEEAK